MEYKVSGTNWLCMRPGPNSRWTTVVQLTPAQTAELQIVIKKIKARQNRPLKLDMNGMIPVGDMLKDR